MYKIQAYNTISKHFTIIHCDTMTERDSIVSDLIASGAYCSAGISYEWISRA